MPSEQISVVIGHPLALHREGIARILVESGHKVIGHAGDWTGVRSISLDLRPDIVLLDVGLPGYGPEAIKELAGRAVVVVVTRPDTPEEAGWAIGSGAKGYLSVNQSAKKFIQKLRVFARRSENHQKTPGAKSRGSPLSQ